MRIESGVTKSALTRQGLIVAMLLAFGAWFGYDGWIGYPRQNMADAKTNFPVVPEGAIPQNPDVTEEAMHNLQAKFKADASRQMMLADLEKAWGKPAYLGAAEANGTGRAAYFVGLFGWTRVVLAGDVVTELEWHNATKNSSAIAIQKMLAGALAVGAMIPLGILLSLMSRRYVLDDDGLAIPGGPKIPYVQMAAIDLKDLPRSGIVRLKYQVDKSQEQTAVLDEEKIAKFEDIVVTLCEKKGWQRQLEQAAAQSQPASGADN